MSTDSHGREANTPTPAPTLSSPEPGASRSARLGSATPRGRRPQSPGPAPAEVWRDYRHQRAAELRLIRRQRHAPPTPAALAQLQEQRERVIEARNRIVERYLPTLTHVAERLKHRLPRFVETGDLVASGVPALMSCVEKFRPARNNRFETFALPRLHGGILDTLRTLDWAPRTARRRNKILEQARDGFIKQHGRPPEPAELAELIDDANGERELILKEKPLPGSVSIDAAGVSPHPGKDPVPLAQQLPTPAGADPLALALRRDLKDFITRKLDRRERLMVVLYYYEAMTMKEVATTLEVSESRVSQVLKLTLEQMRARLAKRSEEHVGRAGPQPAGAGLPKGAD